MGNLHDGHLALVEAARQLADRVVARSMSTRPSLAAGEDLESYPRTPDADREALRAVGLRLCCSPRLATRCIRMAWRMHSVLPPHKIWRLSLEGESRPGHFDGVVTVVARLFNLVDPDVAVFGEKDYQQLLVIGAWWKTWVSISGSFRYPRSGSTGLALSSRNHYLDPAQQQLPRTCSRCCRKAAWALRPTPIYSAWKSRRGSNSGASDCESEYVAIRRAGDLACRGKAIGN